MTSSSCASLLSLTFFLFIIYLHIANCSLSEEECNNMEIREEMPSFRRLTYICNKTTNISFQKETVEELWIDFINCSSLPVDLFLNYSNNLKTLILSAPLAYNFEMENVSGSVFSNIQNVTELQLRGFEQVRYIDKHLLRSLVNIRCLYFEGFGKLYLTFSEMLQVLADLSGTPLTSVVMNDVKSMRNRDKKLDLNGFAIPNVTLTRIAIDNSAVTPLIGQLSKIQPYLTYLSLSLDSKYDDILSTISDIFFNMQNLQSLHVYGYPSISVLDLTLEGFTNMIINNPQVVNYFSRNRNDTCHFGTKILFPKNLRRFSFNSFQASKFVDEQLYLYVLTRKNDPQDQKPLCFDENNQLIHLDLSNSTIFNFRVFTGFLQLEILDVRNATIMYHFIPRHLKEYPRLRQLLMSDNRDIGGFIERDIGADIFMYGQKLVFLDLARCNISWIPQKEFMPLTSLKYLNLSGNRIQDVNFSLQNCTQLIHLDLSYNKIEKFSDNFTSKQVVFLLTKMATYQNTSSLKIDLSGNPLSCQCNALSFIRWMQSKKHSIFINYQNYKCLFPNGTLVTVETVDLYLLESQCTVIKELQNNTNCPCDYQQLQLLYDVRYSLAEYYCHYPDEKLMNMKLLEPNSASKACLKNTGLPTFVIPVVVSASTVIIIFITVIFVVIYRRKRPQEFIQIMKCLDLGRITGTLMAILNEYRRFPTDKNAEELAEEIAYDGFFAFCSDDRNQLDEEVMSKLIESGLKIVTEDEIEVGTHYSDILSEISTKCRSMVLILTPEFVQNPWMCKITKQALMAECAIIPLVYRPLHLDKNELMFSNILKTYLPINWSDQAEEREKALEDLSERMLGHTLTWAIRSITTSVEEFRD